MERAVFYLIRNVELWRLDPLVATDTGRQQQVEDRIKEFLGPRCAVEKFPDRSALKALYCCNPGCTAFAPLDQTLDRFEHMKAVGVDRSRCDDDAMLCPSAPGSSIAG